jgi:surface-anchored protein
MSDWTRNKMRWVAVSVSLAGLWLAGGKALWGQVVLSGGHADIGIGYEDGVWDLHVHVEDPPPGVEYEPDEVWLQVNAAAEITIPDLPAYSFLGDAGDPLWVLPRSEQEGVLFLGIGAEELDPEEWLGSIGLSLKAVEGPGHFFVWDTGVFGEVTVLMNSRDGVDGSDSLSLIPGSHGHFNLGFSAPGEYRISFEAGATHVENGFSLSGPVEYQFLVVPEPSTLALVMLGMGALCGAAWRRPRRRRTQGGWRPSRARVSRATGGLGR